MLDVCKVIKQPMNVVLFLHVCEVTLRLKSFFNVFNQIFMKTSNYVVLLVSFAMHVRYFNFVFGGYKGTESCFIGSSLLFLPCVIVVRNKAKRQISKRVFLNLFYNHAENTN